MDSKDMTVLNGLIAAAEYAPVAQKIQLNKAALNLLQLPLEATLQDLVELLTPAIWQQICHLKHGQSKLIAWPVTASQPTSWLLWTAAYAGTEHDARLFQITDQTALGHSTSHWQHQAQLAAVGQVIAGICHEVNQPLNAMRLRLYGLQAMHQGSGIENIGEHLTALDNQVGRCADTLNNMRSMVGHQSLNLSTFDVSISIGHVTQLLKHQLKLNQVQLKNLNDSPTSISPKALVFGQAQRLEQVLINLINNAHDALAEQAKADENACISLSLERKAHDGVDGLAISVSDNGPGIPTGLQEKVFEAYYTSKSTQKGTGLGLTLCRDLMDDLGGHLSLTSRVGQTTFRLWLPAVTNNPA